jgi:hypothetical protein
MTIPRFTDFYQDKKKKEEKEKENSPVVPGGLPSFSNFYKAQPQELIPDPEPEEENDGGFFKHVWNSVKNFSDVVQAQIAANPSPLFKYKYGTTPQAPDNPRAVAAVANRQNPSLDKFKEDFKAVGDFFAVTPGSGIDKLDKITRTAREISKGLAETFGGAASAIAEDPVGGTMGVASGLAQGIYDLGPNAFMETITGAKLGVSPEELRALTPEEYNKAIKTTAGTVFGTMIGIAARTRAAESSLANTRKLIGGNLDDVGPIISRTPDGALSSDLSNRATALGNLSALPSENLARLALGEGINKYGALGRKIKAGIAEGAIGGAAQSGIENLGEDGMAAKMVTDALLGASIGPLFEIALPGAAPGRIGRDKQWAPEELKSLGWQALAAKQLKVGLDVLLREDALSELGKRVEFILKGDDLVNELMTNGYDLFKNDGYVILNGQVTKEKARAVNKSAIDIEYEGEKVLNDYIQLKTEEEIAQMGDNILNVSHHAVHPFEKLGLVANGQVNKQRLIDIALKITNTTDPNATLEFDPGAGYPIVKASIPDIMNNAVKTIESSISYGDTGITPYDLIGLFDDLVYLSSQTIQGPNGMWLSNGDRYDIVAKAMGYKGAKNVDPHKYWADASRLKEEYMNANPRFEILRSDASNRAILHSPDINPHGLHQDDVNFFQAHGFLPNELVEVNGKEFVISADTKINLLNAARGTLVVVDPKTGTKTLVNSIDISPKLGKTGVQFFDSGITLRRQFFEDYKNRASYDVDQTEVNRLAASYFQRTILQPLLDQISNGGADYMTVTNVTPIVFRGHNPRGTVIPGTGVFYSTKAGVAQSYVRMRNEGNISKLKAQIKLINESSAPRDVKDVEIMALQNKINKLTPHVNTISPINFLVSRLPFKKMFVMDHGAWRFMDKLRKGDMMGLVGITDKEIKGLHQAEKSRQTPPERRKLASLYRELRDDQVKIENKYHLRVTHGIPHDQVLKDILEVTIGTNKQILELLDEAGALAGGADHPMYEPYLKRQEQLEDLDPNIDWTKVTVEHINKAVEKEKLMYYNSSEKGRTHQESGYQLRDKIIAGIMRRNGYDGYIKSIGKGNDSVELVDLREDRRVVEAIPATGDRKPKFKLEDQSTQLEARIYNQQTELEILTKVDEYIELTDWLNQDKPEPFYQILNGIAQQYNILPEEMPNFERAAQQHLLNKLVSKSVSPNEFTQWVKAHNNLVRREVKRRDNKIKGLELSARKLFKLAQTAGYYLDRSESGTFIIRDLKTHSELLTFSNAIDAEQFIRQSGANFDAIDLLNGKGGRHGAIIPPDGIVSGLIEPPDGWDDQFSEPFAYKKGAFEKFRDFANTTSFGKLFAEYPRRLRSFDSTLGTSLFAKFFEPIQQARSAEIAQKIDWLDKLQTIDNFAEGLTADQREQIFHYIETMSPDEIIKNGIAKREMTPMEQAYAEKFVKDNVNDVMFMAIRKHMRPFAKALGAGTIDDKMFQLELGNIATKLGATGIDVKAYMEIHNQLKTGVGQSNFSLGAVFRLFRALKDSNAVPRDIYAKRFNMTPQQLALAEQLDKYFSDLFALSGIADKQRLNGYITHARKYENNDINGAISDFTRIDPEARKFYAAMSRTGELSAIETDPIKAALRYTNALFRTQNTEKAITKALWEARRQLKTIQNKDVRNLIKGELSEYVEGIRGYPEQADKVAQSSLGKFWELMGWGEKAPELRRELVNTSLNVFELGIQGFRIKAGLLDTFSSIALTFAEKGSDRTLNTIRYGLQAFKDGRLEKLRATGAVPPELMALFFSDPEGEAARGLAGRIKRTEAGISKTADIGLKFSGQKHIYAVMQVGTYIENWEYAGKELFKLGSGAVDKKTAYTNLNIQRYGQAAALEFDRLVQLGETEKAAHFYAKVARDASQKVYGLARNPAWMQRNLGRVVGQFSAWPIWIRSALLDGIAQGTAKQRIAYMARYGIAVGALAALGEEFELDFSNWMPHAGMFPGGGPGLQIASDVVTAMTSSYGPEQEAAAARLIRMVPHPTEEKGWNIGPLIPGGIALNDLIQSQHVAEEGFGDVAVYARMFGIQSNTQDKNALKQIVPWDFWEDD